jgi:hypothetical protein
MRDLRGISFFIQLPVIKDVFGDDGNDRLFRKDW